jgi:hypothetical protein
MLSNKSKLSIRVLAFLLLVTGVLGYYFKATPHYATIEFINTQNVEIRFLFQANLNKEICQENLGIASNDLFAFCPSCLMKKQQCLSTLSKKQQTLLFSDTPVSLHLETQTDGRFILNVELDAESTIKPETLRAKLQGLALRANGLSLEPDLAGWARLPVEAKIHIEGIWVD